MDYKGYHIIAEVNVNTQCDFELNDDGEFETLTVLDDGGVDIDNLADFAIENPDGDMIEYADTLDEAKRIVDEDIAKNK